MKVKMMAVHCGWFVDLDEYGFMIYKRPIFEMEQKLVIMDGIRY